MATVNLPGDGTFWNPNAPRYDPATGGYMPAPPVTITDGTTTRTFPASQGQGDPDFRIPPWTAQEQVPNSTLPPDPFASQRAAYDPGAPPAGPGSPTMPASFGGPLPPGQTPPPSESPHVVYTDTAGRGYTPQELQAAMTNPSFMADPLNARTRDIVQQYGAVLNPTGSSGASSWPSTASPSPPPYGGTNVFSDPATANFEKLLNGMVNQFATPRVPPDYQQAVDQLNTYLKQLNGPVYTPEQMNLLQTQALDPIQQQHDQARQALMTRLANQGISPSSGITHQALQQLDQHFEQLRTETSRQFAANAVGLSRQNQATAAALAPQLAGFEYNQMTAQDPRNLQAINLAAMIPQMAMQRLGAAQNALLNPAGIAPLLTLLNNFQQTGYGQGANYGNALTQLLGTLFGLS